MKRCIPDELLELMGGLDKMVASIQQSKKDFADKGVAIEKVEVDAPKRIVLSGQDRYAMVPQRSVMKLPEGRILSHANMLGISKDGGTTWKFADGSAMDKRTAKKVFPSFPDDLELPKQQLPEQLP